METVGIIPESNKYLPYLIEIRRRLLFLLALFIIAGGIGFIYYQQIITSVLNLFRFPGVNLVFTSPFQFLGLALNTSLLLGTAIIFPVLTFQVIAFLKPALRKNEFRALITLLPISIVLFLIGFTYGILVMRYAVQLFYFQSEQIGVGNFLDIGNFLSQTMTTATLLALAFQFPIILAFLMHFKLISSKALAKKRFIVYFLGLVFVVLLPLNDLISDFFLLLPLILLFEATLLIGHTVFKAK